MKILLWFCTLVVAVSLSGPALAQSGKAMGKGPGVGKKAHPHLHAAQGHIGQALNELREAQSANEFDLAGHAAKAKELLDQADEEIKQAAQFANKDEKQDHSKMKP